MPELQLPRQKRNRKVSFPAVSNRLILGVNEFLAQAEPAAQWFGGLFNWTRPAAFREWPFEFGNTGGKRMC
jgi:hypothetical protein